MKLVRVVDGGLPGLFAAAAVHWALGPAPGPQVLDLGAGTGKLTATLVALGLDVTAVEPDPAMPAELRRALPGVRARPGSAEAIPLPDASVDAVLAGNALHWFDMAVAGPEIARVLAPGGILAGLWNVVDDRVGWVAGLAHAAGSAVIGPRVTPTGWRAETAELMRAARFGARERADTLGRIRAFLAAEPETAVGEFTLPMLTCVLRGRRLRSPAAPTRSPLPGSGGTSAPERGCGPAGTASA